MAAALRAQVAEGDARACRAESAAEEALRTREVANAAVGVAAHQALEATDAEPSDTAAHEAADAAEEHGSVEAFNSRYLAFRQHVEFLRERAESKYKTAKAKWSVQIRRDRLVDDVLAQFEKLQNAGQLWRKTNVSFLDKWQSEEAGVDDGGLTSDMYTCFWDQVVSHERGLFDRAKEASAVVLPRADAPPEKLQSLGRVLCKAVLDGHPLGGGLARFLFEFLVFENHGERRVFDDAQPRKALRALKDYDPVLADSWAALLDGTSPVEGLTLEDMDDSLPEPEQPLTAANLPRAIVAGCRRRLLLDRREALEALRDGFTEHVDLTVQLAAQSCDDMLKMVQGKLRISAAELVSCFTCAPGCCPSTHTGTDSRCPHLTRLAARVAAGPNDSANAAAEAGFPAGSRVGEYLRSVLEDKAMFNEAERFRFVQWATALRALPPGGLETEDERISIKCVQGGDERLPVVHTCSRILDLPNYSSQAALAKQLATALKHGAAGFQVK